MVDAVKFKTNSRTIPVIPKSQRGKVIIIHDNAEFAFFDDQLKRIADDWNDGKTVPELMEQEERPWKEIVFALIELAEKDKITRPMGYLFPGEGFPLEKEDESQ